MKGRSEDRDHRGGSIASTRELSPFAAAVIGAIAICAGLFIETKTLVAFRDELRARFVYAPVDAVSQHASVRTIRVSGRYGSHVEFIPSIRYSYTVAGANYVSEQFHLFPALVSSHAAWPAELESQRLAAGRTFTAWFDPAAPNNAVVSRELDWYGLIGGSLIATFPLAIGGVLLFGAADTFRRRSGSRNGDGARAEDSAAPLGPIVLLSCMAAILTFIMGSLFVFGVGRVAELRQAESRLLRTQGVIRSCEIASTRFDGERSATIYWPRVAVSYRVRGREFLVPDAVMPRDEHASAEAAQRAARQFAVGNECDVWYDRDDANAATVVAPKSSIVAAAVVLACVGVIAFFVVQIIHRVREMKRQRLAHIFNAAGVDGAKRHRKNARSTDQ